MNTDLQRAIKAARDAASKSTQPINPPNRQPQTPSPQPPPEPVRSVPPDYTNGNHVNPANSPCEAKEIVNGRYLITGTVSSIKEVTTQYGPVTKILVKFKNGNRVWGNAPKDLLFKRLVKIDSPIMFYATVMQSRDSEKFGLFQRAATRE